MFIIVTVYLICNIYIHFSNKYCSHAKAQVIHYLVNKLISTKIIVLFYPVFSLLCLH
ncbi:hypothetical protein C2G38_2082977 [Gigaspora rosea]|uniref:Uncharacterized protein n=1 Tax=Gigaspora rosea TaxID=44941 RepID=A0A397VAK4_9GLOM|nr:hypothetical protein C2G38_2082977 [Gigaspora rosea]